MMNRRAMIIILALIALALPGLAIAAKHTATRKYNGSFGSTGAGVEFKVKTKNGAVQHLTLFEWHNIPTACAGYSPTATTGELDMTMAVKDEKFHGSGKLNGDRETVTVHGKFKDNEKKATGRLHVKGTISGCVSSDTGVVHWKAHRTTH
jgi:hypothetical protein